MENEIKRDGHTKQLMEVWAIVIADGRLLPPIDDDHCECFMAFPTERDAEACLRSQKEKGYIENGQFQRVA